MDGQRFDTLVKTLRTRRSALGLVTGVGALLGFAHDGAEAKCKKKCGPCKRCKKGKCKPKRGSPRCGPCSTCQRGRCVAQCPPGDCIEQDDGFICLQSCDPLCDLCSSCDRIAGQCEDQCPREFCTTNGCRVPCASPCGECRVCDFGECYDLCDASVACVNGRCDVPCSPTCASDETCLDGRCYPVCDPPCASDEGCVKGSAGNECVALAGDCPPQADFCATGETTSCSAGGRGGRCFKTNVGGSYCSSSSSCRACATDIDCQNQGFGANARCIVECARCNSSGGSNCVKFAGDGG